MKEGGAEISGAAGRNCLQGLPLTLYQTGALQMHFNKRVYNAKQNSLLATPGSQIAAAQLLGDKSRTNRHFLSLPDPYLITLHLSQRLKKQNIGSGEEKQSLGGWPAHLWACGGTKFVRAANTLKGSKEAPNRKAFKGVQRGPDCPTPGRAETHQCYPDSLGAWQGSPNRNPSSERGCGRRPKAQGSSRPIPCRHQEWGFQTTA